MHVKLLHNIWGGAKICDVTNLGGPIALLCSLVYAYMIKVVSEKHDKVEEESGWKQGLAKQLLN